MVGAHIIPNVKYAIPIIMGSNIGTCVTNSFIALTLVGDKHEFKRAFSSATCNDMFNILTTLVIFPIEVITSFIPDFNGVLFFISKKIIDSIPLENIAQMTNANFMAIIVNPLSNLFIILDQNSVNLIASGTPVPNNQVALRCCQYVNITNQTLNSSSMTLNNETNTQICLKECSYWCMPMLRAFGDGGTGIFWIIMSIIILLICLFGIVKSLSMFISGPIAKVIRIAINYTLPRPFKWVSYCILFIFSLALTLIVQSSNIITATLCPLCAVGIVTLQRVYVMTLGSNIGTTITGILTAFTQPEVSLQSSMQLAFVYTLFNTLGVVFWLPIPYLRFPKKLARKLGNIVFEYRWFIFFYIAILYIVGPLVTLGLALIPDWIGIAVVGIPTVFIVFALIIIRIIQKKFPKVLPYYLKNFEWLPIWMRSLEPYDKKISKLKCICTCFKCCKKRQTLDGHKDISSYDNIDIQSNFDDRSRRESIIPKIIRRTSAIEGLVNEGFIHSRKKSIVSNPSSSEDEHDTEIVKDYRRRKSQPKIVLNESENLANLTKF